MKTKFLFLAMISAVIFLSCCNRKSDTDDKSTLRMIDHALETTNSRMEQTVMVIYNNLERAMLNDVKKVRPFYDKAQEARKYSRDLFGYIESIKKDSAAQENVSEKHGAELKNRLDKYYNDMIALCSERDREMMKSDFQKLNDGNYYPADILKNISVPMLTKIQNDIENAQYDIANRLFMQIDVSDFKFDTLGAVVVPQNTSVKEGDEYQATIFLAALNTTANPQIWLGEVDQNTLRIKGAIDSNSVKLTGGMGIYKVKTSGEGIKKINGLIRIKAPDGTWKTFNFKTQYNVTKK